MTALKSKAFDTAYGLYNRDVLSSSDYEAICEGLEEIETLRDRDTALEEMWSQFADVPMDPDTECIEEAFGAFPAGTHRKDIWHWFDQRYSKGVAYLLYGGAEDYVPKSNQLYGLSKLCFGCESKDCQFNRNGECRFIMVHEVRPSISDERGCLDYEYRGDEMF